jgi:hypothetical protein
MFGPALAVVAAAWVAIAAVRAVRGRAAPHAGIVAILLGFGTLHTLAFPSAASGHDYLAACHAPGVALAAALVVAEARGGGGVERGGTARARAARVGAASRAHAALAWALVLAILASNLVMTRRLVAWDDGTKPEARRARAWGEIIRRETAARDVILVPEGYENLRPFYAERKLVFDVTSAEAIAAARERETRRCVFVCTKEECERRRDLVAALDRIAARREADGLVLYALD